MVLYEQTNTSPAKALDAYFLLLQNCGMRISPHDGPNPSREKQNKLREFSFVCSLAKAITGPELAIGTREPELQTIVQLNVNREVVNEVKSD